jgi:hypothetical protein
MTKIDPVHERQRLAQFYAAMSDLELFNLGEDPESLTEWAREALKEEMSKRQLEWTTNTNSARKEDTIVQLRSYGDRISALLDRSLLQSAGIDTFFSNENVASLGGLQTWIPEQEIRLMIRGEDVEAAVQILKQQSTLQPPENSKLEESGTFNTPVVLRKYRDMPEAFVAKSILDAAGIESFLQDDNVVRMDWLWSNAMGGIKLIVREKDVEDAEKILGQGSVSEQAGGVEEEQ